ncbi:MAG: hypothetical protein DI630_13460 [Gordonia sp. (in: high G+C Gram-positive bacteria)]|nr:MAG: hypothetical protein DI630_13460 [Gordonia sp. (in: high G+C Gram-positive bacteria)]
MSAKKKVIAVSALTLGGIAGATGTAYAAQAGVATEAPSGTTTAVAAQPQVKKAEAKPAKPSSTQKQSSATAQATAPAPTISQAEKAPSRDSSGGGQGGISTELPTERKAESKTVAKPKSAPAQATLAAPAQQADAPSPKPAPAATTQTAPAAAVQKASNVTPATAKPAPAAATQTAPAAAVQQASKAAPAQAVTADYADIAATGTDDGKGQGGVATELPASDPTPADDSTAEALADDASTDYSERVEAASQTPSSGTFTPAAPAEPTGQVSTYSAPRENGGEVGIAGGGVATGTAVEVNDTTSYVSNTTTGGGEQATAAQTWDTSNGNYNSTWATTGGVSGTGGFSATNEQTAPNVGTAGVEGQWSSPDGASSVSVTGGATLQNYGVHDASGSIEINTPIGNMAFTF